MISRDNLSGGSINWDKIGIIVEELPQLYQLIKERDISLVIVDSDSFKIRAAVASRIRRNNGLTEIWKLTQSEPNGIEPADYLDGLRCVADFNCIRDFSNLIFKNSAHCFHYY